MNETYNLENETIIYNITIVAEKGLDSNQYLLMGDDTLTKISNLSENVY